MNHQSATGLSRLDKAIINMTYLAWIPVGYAIVNAIAGRHLNTQISLVLGFVAIYLAYLTHAARTVMKEKNGLAEQKRCLLRAIAEGKEIIVEHRNIAGEKFMINEYDINTDLVLITSLTNRATRQVPIKQLEIRGKR